MFKVGQVWRANASGNTYLVLSVPNSHRATVARMTGPAKGQKGWIGVGAARRRYTLIGNNYQETSPAPLLDDEEEAEPMPRETHNLIQNLRRDNKELRRQNKDLRDDIGDMASKLHLANKRTLEVMTPHAKEFPGTAFKRWLSDMAGDLPEQRGCRKEDC